MAAASLGEQITGSSQYPRGPVSNLLEYQLEIELAGGFDILRKGVSGASALVEPDHHRFVPPRRLHGLFDIIPRTSTRSDRIFYVEQTSFAYVAAAVGEGERKPESSATYTERVANVTTIATWIPVTNRMLADSDVLEAIIDSMLVQALDDELQRQILQGDGAGANLLGILNTPGINTYTVATDESMFQAIRKAATATILSGEVSPTALVLHPSDLEALDLEQRPATYGSLEVEDSLSSASAVRPATIIQTLAMPQGTGLIGAFEVGCMLFDRQQGRVNRGYIDDAFVRNIQVLRAELEAAFAVLRPATFTKITF